MKIIFVLVDSLKLTSLIANLKKHPHLTLFFVNSIHFNAEEEKSTW